MSDVCLISLPTRAHSKKPPLSLMSLDAFLEKNKISSSIIDLKSGSYSPLDRGGLRRFENEIIRIILREKPLIVGVSCFVNEVEDTHKLSKRLKKRGFSGKIVAGGVHPTLYPQDFLFKGSAIDIVVVGEGEKTLSELAAALKEKRSWKRIDGIAYLKDGTIRKTHSRELIENLDEIPFSRFEKIDMDYYTKPSVYGIRWLPLSAFYIFTTRGCPSACRFCVNRNLWKTTGRGNCVRFRSVKNVIDELAILKNKYKIDSFYIFDDNFIIDVKRVYKFCREMKKRKLDLIWGCSARINLLNDKLLKAMREAGCIQMDLGVESGSQRSLDIVNKAITIEQVKKVFKMCKRAHIRTFANMMFNFPGETEDDIEKTYRLIEEIRPTYSSFGIMTPYPGTDIFDDLDLNFSIEEYKIYKDAVWELGNEKLRLAKHNLDLKKLTAGANIKYNSVLTHIDYRTLAILLGTFVRSRRKIDYFSFLFSFGKYWFFKRIPKTLKGNLSPYK